MLGHEIGLFVRFHTSVVDIGLKIDSTCINMIRLWFNAIPVLSLILADTIMLRNFYASVVLLLSFVCFTSPANAQTVTLSISSGGNFIGEVVINLFPDDAPISVENFLGYVNRGDYDGTFFHRSVPNFVVQGGGFLADPIGFVPVQAPIQNEFGRSNLRGTVAYARQGGVVNSATSQFFFNIQDSNSGLDDVDGGFTVFGEVVLGMNIIDAINAVPTENLNPRDPSNPDNPNPPGPFTDVPFAGDGFLIEIDSATVGAPFVLGDVSGDGVVNFSDISPFIGVLSASGFQNEADIDRNGSVGFGDISPFIGILSGS